MSACGEVENECEKERESEREKVREGGKKKRKKVCEMMRLYVRIDFDRGLAGGCLLRKSD